MSLSFRTPANQSLNLSAPDIGGDKYSGEVKLAPQVNSNPSNLSNSNPYFN
jgi:hypothetical protein